MLGTLREERLYIVPFSTMDSKPQYLGDITNCFECWTENLEVAILDTTSEFGRRSLVNLRRSTSGGEEKEDVGLMDSENARMLASLLINAADLVKETDLDFQTGITGVRQLPTITLCGNRFFIDERLRQLRNVENPAHSFNLDAPSRA